MRWLQGRWMRRRGGGGQPSAAASDDAFEAFRQRRRFPGLDGFRGLGVLLVIRHHVMDPTEPYGYAALLLFFAISGFLITTLLLRERAATGEVSLRMFYVRRSLRIFPIYYAVLAAYVVLVLAFERQTSAGDQFLSNLRWFATYTSNWFVEGNGDSRVVFYFAWSLATEEQFYLLWPSVVRLTRSRTALASVMIAVAVGSSIVAGLVTGAPAHALATASPICLGCVAACVADHPRGFRVLHTLAAPWWALGVYVVGGAVAVALGAPTLVVGTLMALVVLACCLPRRIPLALPIARGPLPAIGLISYGMYLFHMLAANVVARTVPVPAHSWAQFAAAAALTTGVAALSYNTYERWFLGFKERFRPAPAHPRVVAAPAPNPGNFAPNASDATNAVPDATALAAEIGARS